jgi:hypothetical protein
MRKMSVTDRALLLLSGLLAAYQIAIGIDGLHTLPMVSYTLAFGVLLIAGLLLIILGFDILDSPLVVIAATVIPLSLSLGMTWQHAPASRLAYLAFCIVGFLLVVGTRLYAPGLVATITLAAVHGVAGVVITLMPFILAWRGNVAPGFTLVGVGGALIGLGGLLLSFLKTGRPILPRETILKVLPGLLLLMTAAFVGGFAFG